MEFKEKYTTSEKIQKETDKDLKEKEQKKTQVTNDAFAIGEMIENLISKIEHARISFLR